jgi:hypothetical protein
MNAILTFQGFLEDESRPSGTEDLWWSVIRPLPSDRVTSYHPRTWTAKTVPILEQLRRQHVTRLALVSYSHGQAAAMDLARRAPHYGLDIDLWLAADPVYRPRWLPRHTILQPFSFRAMLPGGGKILVPPSIRRVVWCRQRVDLPQGADLVAENHEQTHIEPAVEIDLPHTNIDNSVRWFDLVQRELWVWLNPPQAIPVP